MPKTNEETASNSASKSADGLSAALEAGNIPATNKAIEDLRKALALIRRGYRLEKARANATPDAELRDTLLKLHGSLRRTADILSEDLAGAGQIDALLAAGPWRHGRLQQHLDATRALLAELSPFCHALSNELAARPRKARHQQSIETWFMLRVHALYGGLVKRTPGIAGPLHRFTRCCAALVDPALDIPQSVVGFRLRLAAALKRDRKHQP